MAGFFKKIFSFGKKEVVEERVDETAPLPPIKWDQLDALKPAAEQVVPEFLKRDGPLPEAELAPIAPTEPSIVAQKFNSANRTRLIRRSASNGSVIKPRPCVRPGRVPTIAAAATSSTIQP